MKNVYTKMTKAIALVALFLMVGVNAWGKVTWSGASVTLTAEWNTIGSTNLQIKKGTPISYNSKRIVIASQKVNNVWHAEAYLRSTAANHTYLITFYAEAASQDITISGGSINQTYHRAAHSTLTITLDMVQNVEYTISSGTQFSLSKVVDYSESEFLIIDETQSKATNDALINARANDGAPVRLKRTLKAGQWNSFCLPFNLGHADFIAAFGENATMYEMTGYDGENITFEAQQQTNGGGTNFQNNRPYLVKPDHDIVNPIFILSSSKVETVDESRLKHTVNGLSFIGTYGYVNIYTEDHSKFFLTNDGGFAYPTRNDEGENLYGTIKGLRCYFKLENSSTDVKGLNCIFEDNATGIIRVENDPFQENGNVYTIDGRNLGNAKNLTPGIYVKNGRKFFVK